MEQKQLNIVHYETMLYFRSFPGCAISDTESDVEHSTTSLLKRALVSADVS